MIPRPHPPDRCERVSYRRTDAELHALLLDRQRLLRELAHVLKRVGHSNPKRAAVNAKRAEKRKALRKHVRRNAEAIASRVEFLFVTELLPGQENNP